MISQSDQLILDHNHTVWEPGFGFSAISTSFKLGLCCWHRSTAPASSAVTKGLGAEMGFTDMGGVSGWQRPAGSHMGHLDFILTYFNTGAVHRGELPFLPALSSEVLSLGEGQTRERNCLMER